MRYPCSKNSYEKCDFLLPSILIQHFLGLFQHKLYEQKLVILYYLNIPKRNNHLIEYIYYLIHDASCAIHAQTIGVYPEIETTRLQFV